MCWRLAVRIEVKFEDLADFEPYLVSIRGQSTTSYNVAGSTECADGGGAQLSRFCKSDILQNPGFWPEGLIWGNGSAVRVVGPWSFWEDCLTTVMSIGYI